MTHLIQPENFPFPSDLNPSFSSSQTTPGKTLPGHREAPAGHGGEYVIYFIGHLGVSTSYFSCNICKPHGSVSELQRVPIEDLLLNISEASTSREDFPTSFPPFPSSQGSSATLLPGQVVPTTGHEGEYKIYFIGYLGISTSYFRCHPTVTKQHWSVPDLQRVQMEDLLLNVSEATSREDFSGHSETTVALTTTIPGHIGMRYISWAI